MELFIYALIPKLVQLIFVSKKGSQLWELRSWTLFVPFEGQTRKANLMEAMLFDDKVFCNMETIIRKIIPLNQILSIIFLYAYLKFCCI